MNWIDVLPREDLPQGGRQTVEIEGQAVLLIDVEGDVFALGARCPHMGADLKNGEVTEGGHIVCPRHHSVFDLKTGSVKEWVPWPPVLGRALGALSEAHAVPVYPTKVENRTIWVGMTES